MSKEKKDILIYSFSGVMVLSLVLFSSIKHYGRKVEDVAISIDHKEGNYFTDQLEILSLMTLEESDYVIGSSLADINPKVLEARVESNPFVEDAQVYRDLKGNLKVQVKQSKPIARLFTNGKDDRYIDEYGNILPVNAKHTARVPLVELMKSFSWNENLNETRYGKDVLQLLRFIEGDPFWKAQIAYITIKKDGEIELFPQVTKQRIVLGYPEGLDKKFEKLKIFYKQILPSQGWNSYKQVSLKYENQIVCE